MKTFLFALAAVVFNAASLANIGPAQAGDHARSLFQFDGSSGYSPEAGVITDRQGVVFGTTTIGGSGPCVGGAGCGTVFALSPPSNHGGAWTYNVLYDFQGGQDGGFPEAPLVLDHSGALYGYDADGTPGTVFRLTPSGNSWTFRILYVFGGKADGDLETVYSPLVVHDGALYGIASGGSSNACGQFGCGSVFKLTQGSGDAPWTKKTLFHFIGGATGGQPTWIAGFGPGKTLYVSTGLGEGAVMEFSPPNSGGKWTETAITEFKGGDDGSYPTSLVLATDGTLYGTAAGKRAGLAFGLTPPANGNGNWTRTNIAAIDHNGYRPGSLAEGANGTLIGTIYGDPDFFAGNVFQLTPPAQGDTWTYTELWNFNRGPDRNPVGVVRGRGVHLFGVTDGGDSSGGILFEVR